MLAVGDDIPLTAGAELLLERLLIDDQRPLWVIVWGGSNVLASVLWRLRDRPDAAKLRSKIRVYTISDQDDTGAWMRHQWPELFYICSVHGYNQYWCATWVGINSALGDEGAADISVVQMPWLKKNIQIGPLGAKYPDIEYGMEGDTPTYLYLVQNGLSNPEEPSWGSWGGRYILVNPSRLGVQSNHYADVVDTLQGADGKTYCSNRATIWRWRETFQYDFAARMQWTLTNDFSKVNHHPVVSVDGDASREIIHMEVMAGSSLELDASESYDPDGDRLTFSWWQYVEPSCIQTSHRPEAALLEMAPTGRDGSKVKVSVPTADKSCIMWKEQTPLDRGSPLHVILQVTDNGTPPLTSYRRVVLHPIRPE